MNRNIAKIGKMGAAVGALGASLFAATAAFAQDATEAATAAAAAATETATAAATTLIKAPAAEQLAAMSNKGDTAWMLISSALVLMMSVPGLALFYGGLVRTKNLLSVCMQVFMIVSIAGLVWACWGYSMAFTGGSTPYVGGFSKIFLLGVTGSTYAATFSNNVYIPELVYMVFQMTFAMITPALIVGAFAERVKFTPLMVFMVLWMTVVYFPIAHMVWYWPERRRSAVPVGRARLRRRHRGAYQRGYCRAGRLPDDRQARRFRQGSHSAALADHDHDRCLAAVGGLVRLQRRLQP